MFIPNRLTSVDGGFGISFCFGAAFFDLFGSALAVGVTVAVSFLFLERSLVTFWSTSLTSATSCDTTVGILMLEGRGYLLRLSTRVD